MHPHNNGLQESVFQLVSGLTSIAGIFLAYRLIIKEPGFATTFNTSRLQSFFYSGWAFDRIYDLIFVKPVVWLSEINKNDFIDTFYTILGRITGYFSILISATQNGRLRWYVMGLTAGLVVLLTLMMAL